MRKLIRRWNEYFANLLVKSLQIRGRTLGEGRYDIYELLQEIRDKDNDVAGTLYGCKLVSSSIGCDAIIVQNPFFRSRVVKLQKGKAEKLSRSEKKSSIVSAKRKR